MTNNRVVRVIGLSFAGLFAVLVTVVAVALLYRAYRQHELAGSVAIKAPSGIDEAMFVNLGGIDQWITIRGQNRDNPVLLYLMGGPGDSIISRAYSLYQPWEASFTVVQWDQRGAGRTFTRNGEAGSGSLSIRRAVDDGLELAEFLRGHLRKERLIIFGVSWGSILGTYMAKERPDLFWAYVGSGQFVAAKPSEEFAYATLIQRARAANDTEALADLERAGAQYYLDIDTIPVERRLLRKYLAPPSEATFASQALAAMFFSPGYTLQEQFVSFQSGTMFSLRSLWPEVVQTDLRSLGTDFQVPYFVIQGEQDYQTPTVFTKAYFASIRAPQKEIVLIEGGGHLVSLAMPETVLAELVKRVRPLALHEDAP